MGYCPMSHVRQQSSETTDKCLVTVVIPSLNGDSGLVNSVRSVLNQGFSDTEIIIVDDQSTDNSVEVAETLAAEHSEVRLIKPMSNSGAAAARNAGLREARGKYIGFLSPGDEYAPNFLKTTTSLLNTNPNVAGFTTDVEVIDAERQLHDDQLNALASSIPSNFLARTVAVQLVGGFPEDLAFRDPGLSDNILFRDAFRHNFTFKRVHQPLLRYRVKNVDQFDDFLDRTTFIDGRFVLTQDASAEENGSRKAAEKRYFQQVHERVEACKSLKNSTATMNRTFESFASFGAMLQKFKDIPGFLHPEEGFALFLWARDGDSRGAIVEIGSLMGLSTCWLAAGSKSAGREKIMAVDHFKGSPEHQSGGTHPLPAIINDGSTLPIFEENLRRMGLRDWVEPHVGSSAEIGATWNEPIRLLFIDGDHSVEGSTVDVNTWSKFIVPGGVMVFHDVDVWPGVTQVYNALVSQNDRLQEVARVRSLRVVRVS